jgi:hypothetical protein
MEHNHSEARGMSMRSRKPGTMIAAAVVLSALAAGSAAAQPAPAQPAAAQPAPAQLAPAQPAAAPRPLSETLSGNAKADYEMGRLLFLSGDYANSLAKFQHAYAVSSDARLLWNMVACASKMHRYKLVIALLDLLKKEGSTLLTAADWAKIAELDTSARSLVGHVQLTVDEPGAEVFIDDEPVGTTPLPAPVMIDAGVTRIRVVKRGFKDHVRSEQVAPGGRVSLVVKLERPVHLWMLAVVAGPGDRISLDGKPLGEGRWEGKVQSGGHTLRVIAPGMTPYQSEIVVQDDQTRRIQVSLVAVVKPGPPAWIWAAAGAAALVGAVVGGVVLLRPDPAPPVDGTLAGAVQTSFGGRW